MRYFITFSYDGTKLAQGRDATKKLILDNPELAEELENKILAKISNSDIESIKNEESNED